jgi:ABC-type uncharacterized transport system permease subunit
LINNIPSPNLEQKDKKPKRGLSTLQLYNLLAPLIAVIMAFLVSAILIVLAKADPLVAYYELLKGGFGSYFVLQKPL